jgi:spore coat polysaccharide biosynthesis protein SpsF (cytidylyltransferase family)
VAELTAPQRAVAVIQARMGSSRLPGKVMMTLDGVPVIKRIFERVGMIEGLADVIVATSTALQDDPLAAYCEGEGMPVFRGHEQDVLDRFTQAARRFDAHLVMRVTADCPFIDPVVSSAVLDLIIDDPACEYADNVSPPTFPDGLDTEVVRRDTLERLCAQCDEPAEREHVLVHIRRHPEAFSTRALHSPVDYSDRRWALDRAEDYEMLDALARELSRRGLFGYHQEILRVLQEHPEIEKINAHLADNQ